MRTRLYNHALDYPMHSAWWTAHTQMPSIPQEMQPSVGFVTESDDGTPLSMVFCWGGPYDPSRTGFFGFHVTNPGADYGALTHLALIKVVEDAANWMHREWGTKFFFGYTDRAAVEDSFVKAGFIPCSRACLTDYFMRKG